MLENTNPDHDPNGIPRDQHGDIVQDIGTRMREKDSYERVIDGLKIAAEACSHLACREPGEAEMFRKLRRSLDVVRRIAVKRAGLEDMIRVKETGAVDGLPMVWRAARDRLHYGLRQAEGGARQLATCHRGDADFSRVADELANMQRGLRNRVKAPRSSLIWTP